MSFISRGLLVRTLGAFLALALVPLAILAACSSDSGGDAHVGRRAGACTPPRRP